MFRSNKQTHKQHREAYKIPRKVQDLIPVQHVWPDGIFLSGSIFSKCWKISDVNYAVASYEEKKRMFLLYSDLLNAQEAGCLLKISIVNRRLNRRELEETMLIRSAGDKNDRFRREINTIVLHKATSANNSMVQDKYITLSVHKKDVAEARAYFARAGSELAMNLSKLNSTATELGANERLRIFHDFYRPGEEQGYAFDLADSQKKGHHFADYICPDSYETVGSSTMRLGKAYTRVLFMRNYATYIKDKMISELCDLSRPMMLSIDVLPIPMDEAIQEAQRRVDGIAANITNWQRSQNKHGNFSAEIPPSMENDRKESREVYDDLTTRDQRLFFAFVSVVHMAPSKRELDTDTESLLSTARKHMCQFAPLVYRQLEGLQTVLPFGINLMGEESYRTLNTESAAVLSPWKAQEIMHKGGSYYGINAITKNPIAIDRSKLLNGNGMILGVSGSGKSMAAKWESVIKALEHGNSHDLLVIDPQGEYRPMIEALGGEVIRVASDSDTHINAMDITVDTKERESPIKLKSEFILSLCDLAMDEQLSAKEKSLVDRCLVNIYRSYIQSGFQAQPPTLQDLHRELTRQPEPEAQQVALALELYTDGSLNTFAQQTNVDTRSRIICYDISGLGDNLKTVGMLVVLDSIYNRAVRNRAIGRKTWVVIDELHTLFSNQYSSGYLQSLWKTVRKLNCILTGITQNIGDLLQSHTARTMLSNSEFLILLNQSSTDLMDLSEIIKIPSTLLDYITNSTVGRGLIKCGTAIVPFENEIPRNSETYRVITTNPADTRAPA